MKKRIFIFIWVWGLLIFTCLSSAAQNAPVTTAATVGGAVAGPVDVTVTVTGFNSIGAVSLAIDYNYSVLHFTGGTPNPLMSSFPLGDQDLGTGYHRITMGWFGSGLTLTDGSTIMTLHFTYISGNSTLNWYDSGPSCEYADANYNVLNDIPTSTYYINGFVCGLLGNPGTISGMTELCAGQTGVEYSVAPVANATGYFWTVPPWAVITSGQNTNAITVDFAPNSFSGDVAVHAINDCGIGPGTYLFITVDDLPNASAGPDFSIPYGVSTTLHAAPGGGSGNYSYHWSPEELLVNPDDQNPQTVILTSTTVFTLLVTNQATFCRNTDEVVVTITGGPLNVSPVALPDVICQGETSQLYSNAGGGSGDYTYEWTSDPPGSPPWSSNLPNPAVSPETSTHYMLNVYDGFTLVSGNTDLSVLPMPTATISGDDTLCGENEVAILQVDLTGTPPWNFTYSFGSTSVFINGQLTTPYELIASDNGDYVISAIEDANCTGAGYGMAIVRKYPIPGTPEITNSFPELISSSCCGNQWYRNDTLIPGATNQTYFVTLSGSYTVIVTMNTCSSLPADPVDIIVGISETNPGQFIFYPNPVSDRVSIRSAKEVNGILNVSLSSADGIVIKEIDFVNEGKDFTVDLRDLPNGFYFLRLLSKEINAVGTLIITR
jgi:hypothetical protein